MKGDYEFLCRKCGKSLWQCFLDIVEGKARTCEHEIVERRPE